jgi:hypothetical protein
MSVSPSLFLALGLAVAASACSGGEGNQTFSEVLVTPAVRAPSDIVTPDTALRAWSPVDAVFATTMVFMERGVTNRQDIWGLAETGMALRVSRNATGVANNAALVDATLKMTSMDLGGSQQVTELAPDGVPPNTTGLSLIVFLPPAGVFRDPRLAWEPATVDARGTTLRTSRGGPYEATVLLDERTLFPLEFSTEQDGIVLAVAFENSRLIALTAPVRKLFDVENLAERLR